MIWLKEGGLVTKNQVTGEKEVLEQLRGELLDYKTFRFFCSYPKASQTVPSLEQNILEYAGYDNMVIKIGEKDEQTGEYDKTYRYRKNIYQNPKPVSSLLVCSALGMESENFEESKQLEDIKLIRMFNFSTKRIGTEKQQFEFAQNIESLEEEESYILIRKTWPDLAFFKQKVLDVIAFEPIEQYDYVEYLKSLDPVETDRFQKRIATAKENNKVLEFVKKIK